MVTTTVSYSSDTTAVILLGIFVAIGAFLILLGIWITARMYGRHSVEVDAECVDIAEGDYVHRDIVDHRTTIMRNAKQPVYRYWYNGQQYTSQVKLRSNMPWYQPKTGPCTIRINPDHPERVYSSQRKVVSAILISIGALYLVMVAVIAVVFKNIGAL